jgi:putative two-component system response regulator
VTKADDLAGVPDGSADRSAIPAMAEGCVACRSADPADARILIADDEPVNTKILRKYLRDAGHRDLVTTSDARSVIDLWRDLDPDVVLLDYLMPGLTGLQILERRRDEPALGHAPVLLLTASSDQNVKVRALELGATDFLNKPVEPTELVARMRNVLAMKRHHDHLVGYSSRLESEVRARTAELEHSRTEVILCLARAAEYRDRDTGYHIVRVGRYAGVIARAMGFTEAQAAEIGLAAQLHDVGKIGVPDEVLRTTDEFETSDVRMQRHCAIGKSIVQTLPDSVSWPDALTFGGDANAGVTVFNRSPILDMAARIALTHHERWDGTGYPLGLAGEQIPIEGRIVAVADAFDALSRTCPGEPTWPREQCFAVLEEGRGSRFDAAVVDALRQCLPEAIQIQIRFAEAA